MDFDRRVGLVCRAIPDGCVSTYGQIALLCGKPRCARHVGRALGRDVSPQAYKVIGAGGRLSGAAAFLQPGLQAELLRASGVWVSEQETVDLKEYLWRPTQEELAALQAAFVEQNV